MRADVRYFARSLRRSERRATAGRAQAASIAPLSRSPVRAPAFVTPLPDQAATASACGFANGRNVIAIRLAPMPIANEPRYSQP